MTSTVAKPSHSLRSCLGRFATGVVVVTFDTVDGPRGLTVNAFTSVSMEPPLILVSVSRQAKAHDLLHDRPFCVNVLGAEQEALALQFAGGPDSPVTWVLTSVAPRLSGVLAYLACTPWRAYDGGDHTLILGEVADYQYRDGDALAFHSSRFTAIGNPQLGMEDLL